eukprot:362554-Chlamydomonas_euryale.AAC.4
MRCRVPSNDTSATQPVIPSRLPAPPSTKQRHTPARWPLTTEREAVEGSGRPETFTQACHCACPVHPRRRPPPGRPRQRPGRSTSSCTCGIEQQGAAEGSGAGAGAAQRGRSTARRRCTAAGVERGGMVMQARH